MNDGPSTFALHRVDPRECIESRQRNVDSMRLPLTRSDREKDRLGAPENVPEPALDEVSVSSRFETRTESAPRCYDRHHRHHCSSSRADCVLRDTGEVRIVLCMGRRRVAEPGRESRNEEQLKSRRTAPVTTEKALRDGCLQFPTRAGRIFPSKRKDTRTFSPRAYAPSC